MVVGLSLDTVIFFSSFFFIKKRVAKPLYSYFIILLSSSAQDVHESIASNKPAVLETIVMGEQFLQENRNNLSPEQQEEMQRKIDELRSYFDQVDHRSEKINTDTQQTIDRLEKELEEEVTLRCTFLRNDSLNKKSFPYSFLKVSSFGSKYSQLLRCTFLRNISLN